MAGSYFLPVSTSLLSWIAQPLAAGDPVWWYSPSDGCGEMGQGCRKD